MTERLLSVRNLRTHFAVREGFLRRQVATIRAVDDVSFELSEQQTLGVVGESGCGKSTMARSILRLIEPTSGEVTFMGQDVLAADRKRLRELRRDMQIVFQDPYASLNPRLSVADIIAEPMRIHGMASGVSERVEELLTLVGLRPAHSDRYPHEFSGGQRQRIGIARALALNPRLLLLDEPVSALDVSVQAQVLNLLGDLQELYDLSYILVAHDLSVVRHMSDRIAVMYLGRIVESAPSEVLHARPAHPYTHALLSAVPIPDPQLERRREHITLRGDAASHLVATQGCVFAGRCPIAEPVCSQERPVLTQVDSAAAADVRFDNPQHGHAVACHFPLKAGESLLQRLSSR